MIWTKKRERRTRQDPGEEVCSKRRGALKVLAQKADALIDQPLEIIEAKLKQI